MYLHSNTCFVTMAARSDSCCRRPGPKLAEGFGTLLFPFIFSPPLHNSSVTFALLWLHPGDNPRTCCPARRELCSAREQGAAAGVSLEGSDYPERLTKMKQMELPCGFVVEAERATQGTKAEDNRADGPHLKPAVVFESLLGSFWVSTDSLMCIASVSGIQHG